LGKRCEGNIHFVKPHTQPYTALVSPRLAKRIPGEGDKRGMRNEERGKKFK
jgi:hypothetical protein